MNNFAFAAANKLHAARSDTITAGDRGNLNIQFYFSKKELNMEHFHKQKAISYRW